MGPFLGSQVPTTQSKKLPTKLHLLKTVTEKSTECATMFLHYSTRYDCVKSSWVCHESPWTRLCSRWPANFLLKFLKFLKFPLNLRKGFLRMKNLVLSYLKIEKRFEKQHCLDHWQPYIPSSCFLRPHTVSEVLLLLLLWGVLIFCYTN